jgi:hypothetical protein
MRLVVFSGIVGLALLGGILAVTSSHRSAGHRTESPLSVDGKPIPGDGSSRLHRGQLLRVRGGASTLAVSRLECKNDLHRIKLVHGTWRVPDLPSGEYRLAGSGPKASFVSLVTVQSHDAPCPGA